MRYNAQGAWYEMSKGTSLLVVLFFLVLAWGIIGFATSAQEPTLEERIAKIEGILEQMNQRLNYIGNLSWAMLALIGVTWATVVTGIILKRA
jgi:hypothetical protein